MHENTMRQNQGLLKVTETIHIYKKPLFVIEHICLSFLQNESTQINLKYQSICVFGCMKTPHFLIIFLHKIQRFNMFLQTNIFN